MEMCFLKNALALGPDGGQKARSQEADQAAQEQPLLKIEPKNPLKQHSHFS